MADLLGGVPGIVVGVGVGAAASAALEPAIEIPKQEAWAANPNRILDAATLARLVAQGAVDLGFAEDSAKRDGYAKDKLDALVYLAQTVPGFAEAVTLWRLGLIDDPLFTHVLTKAGMDQRYVQPILQSKLLERLGLGDIAYGVVRGILPAPSWVPVAPPATGDYVPRFPQVDIDPLTLAHEIGFDENMLRLMVGRSGLSMAPVMAAQALFRSNAATAISGLPDVAGVAPFSVKPYVGPNDYLLAIAEGDLRTEWADAVRETARQILTVGQYAELELRGFISKPTRRALTAQHGMSDFDSDLLYDVLGRAPGIHAVTTGLARGGTYDGQPKTIPEPYLAAVQRANIRPEWYDVEFANRFSLPSAFVLRSMAQKGEIDPAQTNGLLLEIGWPPWLAAKVTESWTGATLTGSIPATFAEAQTAWSGRALAAAAGDPHVTKAQNQLWTTTHKAYVDYAMPQTQAAANLAAIGVPGPSQTQVFQLWDAERASFRHGLTTANIHKAYAKGDTNDATGLPWTKAEAAAELVALGYNPSEADQYLDIP